MVGLHPYLFRIMPIQAYVKQQTNVTKNKIAGILSRKIEIITFLKNLAILLINIHIPLRRLSSPPPSNLRLVLVE